jgi:short-subunit dehydrogenase
MTVDSTTGRVVVITGASSGIGRATAEALASTGARLVLTARGEPALQEAAAQCRKAGVEVLVIPTDVTQAGALEHLSAAAIQRFGRIDVWINNAGVGAVGAFETTPMAAHEQVVATDLVGYMRGAHAVLPQFKTRGRGILINVLSLGSWAPTPYAAAYSAAKFGLRGFTDALRGELSAWRDIHVCNVHPSFVDTPGMQHGGNYVGRELKPPPGVVGVDAVVRAIVDLMERPRRQVVVGRGVTAMARAARFLAPGATGATVATMARLLKAYFVVGRRVRPGSGNLFAPSRDMGASGGWRRPGVRVGATVTAGVAVLLAGVWLARFRKRMA